MTPREKTAEHVAYLGALAIVRLPPDSSAMPLVSFNLMVALRESSPWRQEHYFAEAYRLIREGSGA